MIKTNNEIIIEAPRLTGYQKNILECEKRFTITEACTKSGKTFSHLWWLFKESHKEIYKRGNEFWWIAPVYSQAEIAFRRLKNKVFNVSGYHINESKLFIITPKGTILRFKSAEKPDNLYGEDVYTAVFDEFTRARFEAWVAIRSTLTATNGKCKLIGNFKGIANWGHQLAEKAKDKDSEYQYFRITAWDAVEAGILKKKEIEQAKKDLPKSIFLELYMAEPGGEPGQLISSDAINDLFTNKHVQKTGIRSLTCDVAMLGSDKLVIFVWNGDVIIDFKVMEKSDSKMIVLAITSLQQRHGIGSSRIVYDNDGVGAFLSGYFPDSVPFVNNAKPIPDFETKDIQYKNLKSQCYFLMAEEINKRNYYIECDLDIYKNDLMEELELVRNRAVNTDNKLEILRKDEIYSIIGRSSDFTDSMAMKKYLDIIPVERVISYQTKRTYR